MANDDDAVTRSMRKHAQQDAAAAPALISGTIVGSYVVESLLASGGFGSVYRVRHLELGRLAALKVLHPERARVPTNVERFRREALAVNAIRHPGVIEIYEIDTLRSGEPFVIMELLEGSDLDARLAAGAFSPEAALAVVRPLCGTLDATHGAGIIHRDIKASNVFLHERDGVTRVVLLDFGVAKLLDAEPALTTSQEILGTPATMSPEQIVRGTVDARTDVYAVGALLFHMLTGRFPFEGGPNLLVEDLHLHANRPRASRHAPVSRAIDEVIIKAMSVDAAERYGSAGELAAAFERAVLGGREEPTVRPVLAAFIEARIADPQASVDAALVADIAAITSRAVAALEPGGFRVALRAASSVLFVRPLSDEREAEIAERSRAIATVVVLANDLARRPSADARVHLSITLHRGDAVLAGEQAVSGDILRLGRWVPEPNLAGVVATPEALAGTDACSEPLREHGSLRLVSA